MFKVVARRKFFIELIEFFENGIGILEKLKFKSNKYEEDLIVDNFETGRFEFEKNKVVAERKAMIETIDFFQNWNLNFRRSIF